MEWEFICIHYWHLWVKEVLPCSPTIWPLCAVHKLTYLTYWPMSCHSQLLFSIQFYLELPLPYSSGCIWILLSPFLTPNLFSKYSVVTHFFHGLVALTYFWIILGNGVEMCLQMLLLMLQNVAAVLGCDAWPQSGEIQRAGVMYVQPSAISSVSNIFTSFRWINFLSHCTVRCYAPAEGALSNDAVWRLSVCLSVCLSRTSGLSREQRGLGRLKLAQR